MQAADCGCPSWQQGTHLPRKKSAGGQAAGKAAKDPRPSGRGRRNERVNPTGTLARHRTMKLAEVVKLSRPQDAGTLGRPSGVQIDVPNPHVDRTGHNQMKVPAELMTGARVVAKLAAADAGRYGDT